MRQKNTAERGDTGVQLLLGRLAAVVLGFLVGLLLYYVTAVVATAPFGGGFTLHPWALLLLAGVVAVCTAIAWRWPTSGFSGGFAMLIVIAFALEQRISWSSGTTRWLDPIDAIGFGGASAYPAMAAAALVTVSVFRLTTVRAQARSRSAQPPS